MILILCPPGPAADRLHKAAPNAVRHRGTVHAAPFHAGEWYQVDMDAHTLRDRLRRFSGWLAGVGNASAQHYQVCELPAGLDMLDWIEEQVAKDNRGWPRVQVPWRAPSPGEEGSPVQDDPQAGEWDGKPHYPADN